MMMEFSAAGGGRRLVVAKLGYWWVASCHGSCATHDLPSLLDLSLPVLLSLLLCTIPLPNICFYGLAYSKCR